MSFGSSFASVVVFASLRGGTGFTGFGFGGGRGRTIAFRIDFRSVGFALEASVAEGLLPVFLSDLGDALVFDEGGFLSVVFFFVTAASVLR